MCHACSAHPRRVHASSQAPPAAPKRRRHLGSSTAVKMPAAPAPAFAQIGANSCLLNSRGVWIFELAASFSQRSEAPHSPAILSVVPSRRPAACRFLRASGSIPSRSQLPESSFAAWLVGLHSGAPSPGYAFIRGGPTISPRPMNSPRQVLAVFSCSIFSGKEARRPVRRAGRGEDHKSRGAPASADPGRLDPGGVAMRVFAGRILAALRRRCCGRESLIGMQIGISAN